VIDSNKKEVRDIYSLAIKSIIQELKEASAINMITSIYPKLSKGLKTPKDEIKEECLEILTEIFKIFGTFLYINSTLVNKDDLIKLLCEFLQVQNINVRKRATNCLG
jgi:hypothetical protein